MLAAMAGGLPSIGNQTKGSKKDCVCGMCTCGSHKCPGCIPHPKFDATSTNTDQFKDHTRGLKKPVKMSEVLLEKRKKEVYMTKADADHYATTSKSTLDATLIFSGPRTTSFKPKARRVHTTPYEAVGQTMNNTAFVKPEAKIHRTQRIIPATTAGASMGGGDPGVNPTCYFTTTNRDLYGDSESVMRDTLSPQLFRMERKVPPSSLTLNPKQRLEGESSYKSQFPLKVSDSAPPTRLRSVPPHVAKTKQPKVEPKEEIFRSTSALAYEGVQMTGGQSRCPASFLPRKAVSEDGHQRFKEGGVSPVRVE